MNVIKYDPFRELRSLHNEMNRLFTGNLEGQNAGEFAQIQCRHERQPILHSVPPLVRLF